MRRTPLAIFGALALLTSAGLTTSCNKQNSTPLENVQTIDNQITGFALLTDDSLLKEPLAKTIFTIRHSETGQITNPQALPYRATDYKVKLNIQVATRGAHVDIITADGQTTRWTSSTQTFSSEKLLHGIRLRVSQDNGGDSGAGTSYTYRVTFKRYAADPQTFSWSAGSATGLPAFASVIGTEQGAGGATIVYYLQHNGANAASTFTSATGTWSPVALSGIPAGEKLVSLLQHERTLYVTTSAHKLYRGSQGSFTEVALPSGSPAPVSVLAMLGSQLCLVGQTSSGALAFARYDLTAGTVTSQGHRPQTDFPITGGIPYQGSSAPYQGASLYLAGGRTASGKVASTLWSTTNGTDWLVVDGRSVVATDALHQTIAHSHSAQRLYRFATTQSGLLFTLSRDGGHSWEDARSTALSGLTTSDFAGYPVFAITSADGTQVYLLRGGRSASESSRLYVGQFGGLRTTTE